MSDAVPELKLEIGHVLFIDIVSYSQLLIDQQSERIGTLKRAIRGSAQFRLAEAEGKVLRLPTGDGAALVFRTTPESPVLCALEIARELKKHPELPVRMGIHSGPVNAITDLNEQANIAGAGINIAQRVMDCGDAGHILLSKHVAEDLEHYPRWKPYLHDLGPCEVKHGFRISVVNFYTDEVGNPAVPEKFKTAQPITTQAKETRSKVVLAFAIGFGALAVIAVFASLFMPGLWRSNEKANRQFAEALPIPAKSIAVLPFENLSRDPDNAYFVEGIQDEILTRLSKIADLKVISRTSTQKYKSAPDNLRAVARQLGVANILEGSVQRSNDQVRVNVQLINALTDAHLWADTYDRHLTDIFAVESEIAKTIAETLQAKLTGSEKAMIAAQPTSDTTAYELYHKGRSLWEKRSGDNLPKAIAFYEQAIARDPNYAPAYAGLANSYVLLPLYFSVPQREATAKAREAALKALQIDPKLAEAHNALGKILNFDDLDLGGAAREFQRAIELQPNNATAHQWYGNGPLDSLGRFDEAIAETRRAVELDPLSPIINTDRAYPLYYSRRYDEALAQSRKTIELDPGFFYARQMLGMILQAKGDLPGAIAEFEKARQLSGDPLHLALLVVAKTKMGDKHIAQQALAELDKVHPDRQGLAYDRALVYLAVGNKDEALRWLEQSYADRDGANLSWINVEPMLESLRGDPRFEALVQKVIAPKSEAKP